MTRGRIVVAGASAAAGYIAGLGASRRARRRAELDLEAAIRQRRTAEAALARTTPPATGLLDPGWNARRGPRRPPVAFRTDEDTRP